MPKEDIIWKSKKAAELWHQDFSLKGKGSGIIDEKYVENYIASKRKVKVVSLGVGTGRELEWLNKLKNIREIIGIDYSQSMLDVCKEVAKKCHTRVSLIKDNLLSLKKFAKFIKGEKSPLIFVCLINTLGNFEEKDREKVLKKVNGLMKRKDRLILCLYKRPERIKTKMFLPRQIKIKGNSEREIKLGEAIEYAFYKFWWSPILDRYRRLPRFWYDDKTNNITIYVGKKKILISHRFSGEEIKELCQEAKLKIEKLIEGKFMWVVILKT